MLIRRDKNTKFPIRKVIVKKEKHYLIVMFWLIVSITCVFYCYSLFPKVWSSVISDLDYHKDVAEKKYASKNFSISKKEMAKFKSLYFKFDREEIHHEFTNPAAVQLEFSTLKIETSWRKFEYFLMVFYFVFFFSFSAIFSKWLKFFEIAISDHLFQAIGKLCPKSLQAILERLTKFVNILCMSKKSYWLIFSLGIVGFILFNVIRLLLVHYGVFADVSNFYKIFSGMILCSTIIFIFLPFVNQRSTNEMLASRRYVFLKFASIAVISFMPIAIIEKGSQIVKLGLFPNPRYKKKELKSWHQTSLTPGLYRHINSKQFFYVNEAKQLRSRDNIATKNLILANGFGENEFRYMSRMTAKVYFEDRALHQIKSGKLLDALDLLELGCKYAIFSVLRNPSEKPNIRLFKLYFGLCHKNKLKHHLAKLRTQINQKKLRPVLQPSPQKWMRSKAWCFKNRWHSRREYNKHKLTSLS